jgi:hypothetical protein
LVALADHPDDGGASVPHPTLPECDPDDPSLLLPDLIPDPPRNVRSVRRTGVRLVEFTTAIGNIGDGPLLMESLLLETDDGPVTQGFQLIRKLDGSECARATGQFEFHGSHNHWHFDNFVGYELRIGDPDTGELAIDGQKASFCLLDIERVRGFKPNDYPRQLETRTCNNQEGLQGISVGWKDIYGRALPDQNIKLDQPGKPPVPPGGYFLVNRVDPDGLLWETDVSNNASSTTAGVSLRAPTTQTIVRITPPTAPEVVRPPQQPRLRVGRDRPPRPTRPPRPPRPTRPARLGSASRLPTPTPQAVVSPAPSAPTPEESPAVSRRPARPERPARPQRPPRPTRPPRLGSAPRLPTATPQAVVSPAPSAPTPVSGGSPTADRCEDACRYDISQLRYTWYDNVGLSFSMFIKPGACPILTPEGGEGGVIHKFDWLNTAGVDTGLSFTDNYVLRDAAAGTTSRGGTINLRSMAGGHRFTYTLGEDAIARADAGFDGFPSVFDMCMTIGDQKIAAHIVCQPKRQGLLCHEG